MCGYAVEWVRSCYESDWRLFQGSQALTRGRYVFVSSGTPHYPGLHRFGSRNWTAGEERQDGTVVGEVDTGRQVWFNGGIMGILPPAVLVGSAACVAGGERLLPEVVPTFAGGYDVRCGGHMLPIGPLLWVRGEELASLNVGQSIVTWPHHPAVQFGLRGATLADFPSGQVGPPTVYSDPATARLGGRFQGRPPPQGAVMFDSLAVPGDYTLVLVARLWGERLHGPAVFATGVPRLFALGEDSVTHQPMLQVSVADGVDGAFPFPVGQLPLVSLVAVRQGDMTSYYARGVLLGSLGPGGQPLTLWFLTSIPDLPPDGWAWVPEVMLWTRALSAGERSALLDYLSIRYPA